MITVETTKRKDKIAIWAAYEGDRLNIWDLPPKQLTEDVLKAIVSAVERGMVLQRQQIQKKLNKYIDVKVELNHDK
jgi:hypothetical protein